MLRMLLLTCLVGYTLAFWEITAHDHLDKVPVPDLELCHFGYYNLADEDCCHYYQCNPDGKTATRRCCMNGTYWNTDTWSCDWTWVDGTCNEDLTPCWDPKPQPPNCTTVGESPQHDNNLLCCQIGHVWWDHSWGYGDLYEYEPAGSRWYFVCGEVHLCPVDSVFDGNDTCACTPVNTTCDCMDWWFRSQDQRHISRTTIDKNQGVPIRKNKCKANEREESLECVGNGPAYLDVFQKAYFVEFTLFAAISSNSGGFIIDNGDDSLNDATFTVYIEERPDGRYLCVRINGLWTLCAQIGPDDSGLIKFVFTVYKGVAYLYTNFPDITSSPYQGVVAGSDWPLELGPWEGGVPPNVVFHQFGMCSYGWTQEQVEAWYQDMSLLPNNPH